MTQQTHAVSSRQIRLIVDGMLDGDTPTSRPAAPAPPDMPVHVEPIRVDASGCQYLNIVNGRPVLGAEPAAGGAGEALLLETVQVNRQPRLLVVSAGRGRPRVNGRPATAVALLGETDQLSLPGSGLVFHVSYFDAPYVGPVPQAFIGQTCPVCRTRFVAGMRVYICPGCSTAMHLAQADAEDGLRCAEMVGECLGCRSPVSFEQRYSYLPQV